MIPLKISVPQKTVRSKMQCIHSIIAIQGSPGKADLMVVSDHNRPVRCYGVVLFRV